MRVLLVLTAALAFCGGAETVSVPDGALPSYIPSRTFAVALMDLLDPIGPGKDPAMAGSCALTRIREGIEKLDNKKAKQSLLAAIDGARDDWTKARQNLEDWYRSAMDHVSGWYKFRTQWAVLLISITLSILFNADIIGVAHQLSRDQTLRQAVLAMAAESAKQIAWRAEQQIPSSISKRRSRLSIWWVSQSDGLTDRSKLARRETACSRG